MPHDERDVLQVLKAELNFVQKGGYGHSPRDPLRAQLVFEDSPSCMNFDALDRPEPCSECLLMQFVPAEKRDETTPCRHIPLTHDGQTLFDLYHGATQPQVEEAVTGWLREVIAELENNGIGNGKAIRIAPAEGTSAQQLH